MLVTLWWWLSGHQHPEIGHQLKSVTNILNRSPSSKTFHQYISSPTSVTNIAVIIFKINCLKTENVSNEFILYYTVSFSWGILSVRFHIARNAAIYNELYKHKRKNANNGAHNKILLHFEAQIKTYQSSFRFNRKYAGVEFLIHRFEGVSHLLLSFWSNRICLRN